MLRGRLGTDTYNRKPLRQKKEHMMIPMPMRYVDSSFDSDQNLDDVKERYKTHQLDSDAAVLDRRVSFAAYACDPYPMVP